MVSAPTQQLVACFHLTVKVKQISKSGVKEETAFFVLIFFVKRKVFYLTGFKKLRYLKKSPEVAEILLNIVKQEPYTLDFQGF